MALVVGRDAPSQDALGDVAIAVLADVRLAVAAWPLAALNRAGGGGNHHDVVRRHLPRQQHGTQTRQHTHVKRDVWYLRAEAGLWVQQMARAAQAGSQQRACRWRERRQKKYLCAGTPQQRALAG